MQKFRLLLAVSIAAFVAACGGASEGTTNPTTTGGQNSGDGRTMTATYNGTNFRPTLMTSAYLNGQVSLSANDGSRFLTFAALNVTSTGTYSVAPGNANTALAQWIDATGTYSTGFNGTGTITFTVLQLGRVAGSFAFTVKNNAPAASQSSIALNGTFDIKFP